MNWSALDFPTRAGLVAAAIAVVAMVVPPIGIATAIMAIGFSSVGWQRSRRVGATNVIARNCVLVCVSLIAIVVVGSAIYSAT